MKTLLELLKENESLNGFKITEVQTLSYELFFVHEKLETVRSTDTLKTDVTVYVDHDGARGDSSFPIYASMSEGDIRNKIAEAAARAKLVSNQPYRLPCGGRCAVTLPTDLNEYQPQDLAAKIARAVFSADCPAGGSINALEVFLYVDTVRVQNSEGVDKTQKTYRVMIEAIPTYTDEKESVELYEDYRFTVYNEEKLKKEIACKLREAHDRREAKKPQGPLKIRVLLRPQEITQLLMTLAYDLNYASVYSHANLHKVGEDLQPAQCDKLTLTLRGSTPGSERSASFDEDGTDLTDTVVIEKGVVKSNFGADRFGQYLGVKKPSGNLRCAKLERGTLSEAELQKTPYIECASMSGLQLDLYNDYIGGEIRLAYYFDGEKTVPITGISMSGRLSEALKSLRLSEKVDCFGPYEGPDRLLLADMEII